MGLANAAGRALAPGAGEGAGGVAEQFGFDQGFRQCRAVHRDEGFFGARPGGVDGAGEKILAGAGFALQQDGHGFFQHAADLGDGFFDALIAGVQRRQPVRFGPCGRGVGGAEVRQAELIDGDENLAELGQADGQRAALRVAVLVQQGAERQAEQFGHGEAADIGGFQVQQVEAGAVGAEQSAVVR